MANILIKNGLVYDGTETAPVKKDILIRNDKIIGLGVISKRRTDEVIDAMGAIVMPGIIDINTDSDHFLSLFFEPYQEDFIKQGVTTIIGGNCGVSLAPFLNSSLNIFYEGSGSYKININWHSVKEFLEILRERKLGVNFGTLVGQATVRFAFTKDEPRDLTKSELEAFKKILAQSLKEGAFGFSSGLIYFHSYQIPYYEILELVKVVAELKGVYAVHLRDTEDNLISAVREVIDLAKESGVNLEINHFQPLKKFLESYRKTKEEIEKESSQIFINFDCYPFDSKVLPLYLFLPRWAQERSLEKMLENVFSKHLENRLLEHFRKFQGEEIKIASVPPPLKHLVGKTLEEFAINANLRTDEALLKLMRLSHLKAFLLYRSIEEELLDEFLVSPQAIISSNGASLPAGEFKHERNYNTFPKFLNWVRQTNKLPLEKAIAKITSLPAQKYGLIKRGLIKEGYYADIVILRDGKPTETIVNGQIALKEGKPLKTLSGQVLKKI